MKENNNFIELTTYGDYDEGTDTNEPAYFQVPRKWLEKKITPQSVEDFLKTYTWDTTISIHMDALLENVLILPEEPEKQAYEVHVSYDGIVIVSASSPEEARKKVLNMGNKRYAKSNGTWTVDEDVEEIAR